MQLRPVRFEYSKEFKSTHEGYDGNYLGFIAQEVQKICPEMVTQIKETLGSKLIDDFNLLNQGNLIPMLVNAMQEQQTEFAKMKDENIILKNQNDELLKRLEKLEHIMLQKTE